MFGTQQPIYLDHSATTPLHPAVIEAMLPYWTTHYGNPSSVHRFGRRAGQALEEARATIAALLNVEPAAIVFTASGSEANNLALRGVLWAARAAGRGDHLITSAIEHKAVLETARDLAARHGFVLTVLPVDGYGRIAPEALAAALRPQTVLVSIMAANNEIGTLQPIDEIGALVRAHGALFHSDAVQAIGSQAWDLARRPIDLLTLAPHKFNGPKGIGVLVVNTDLPLQPVLTGGSQEVGRRPGTENVAFAVGAAKALELAQHERAGRLAHLRALRDALIDGILAALPQDVILTGHPAERLPHHASFAVRHARGNDLLMHLDIAGIAAGSGSACSVGNPQPSAVLEALGLGPEWTSGGLRLTVGQGNTPADVERAVAAVVRAVHALKPLAVYG